MEEKEFSFGYFFKYAWRYVIVILLCSAIGLGLGVIFAGRTTQSSVSEKYTATIRFNSNKYAEAVHVGELTEADYALYSRMLSQILETAHSPEVAANTYISVKDSLYTNKAGRTVSDKSQKFHENLELVVNTDAIVVSFTYAVESDEDKALAKKVVETYVQKATDNVKSKHPEFAEEAFAGIITVSEIEQTFELDKKKIEQPFTLSPLLGAVLGAMIGAILGAVVLFVAYLADPRIKTVKDVLPEGCCSVVCADRADGVTNFAALVKAADAKKILIAAPVADALCGEWTDKLSAYLTATGAKVKKVIFEAGNPVWFNYFENAKGETADFELYVCDNAESGVVAYISRNTDVAAVFADLKAVKAKTLKATVESTDGCQYLCTLTHGAGRAYLD